jgi:hypothetical protein
LYAWKKNCPINSCESLNFKVLWHPFMKSQNYGNPYTWTFFTTIFQFAGQFFFQNAVFKPQEDFLELGIRVFLVIGLECFETFFILQIWDKPVVLKKLQIQFQKDKETTYTLVFAKYLVVFLRSHSIRAFWVFLEYSLRLIRGTWRAEKNWKPDSDSALQK